MQSLTPLFAAVFGLGIPEIVTFIIPLAGILLGGVLGVTAMYFKHQKMRLWHETARLALEKGQPLPPAPGSWVRPPGGGKDLNHHDLRGGLILMGIGAAMFVFLGSVAGDRVGYVGAIPGFMGLALVLHWILNRVFASRTTPPPPSSQS